MDRRTVSVRQWAEALTALLLAGCASVPTLHDGPKLVSRNALAAERTLAASRADWPQDRWWEHYGDAQLDGLIDEAVRQSPTLEIAAARVRRAEALADQTRAQDAPQVTLGGSIGENKASYWNGAPFAGVPKGINEAASLRASLDWNLDFLAATGPRWPPAFRPQRRRAPMQRRPGWC